MARTSSRAGAACAAAAAALVALPTLAEAGPRTTWTYDMTARVEQTSRWSASERSEIGDPVEPCAAVRTASGSSVVTLATRRPTRVLVSALPGAPVGLDVGTHEGAAIMGSARVEGSDLAVHEGAGTCATANPPVAADTSGCGVRDLRGRLTLAVGARGTVTPDVGDADEERDACPTSPWKPIDWTSDDGPSLLGATGRLRRGRLGTRQFTLRGARTWTGRSADDAATQTVTWQWEATYRRVRR